ncbi:MAG: hypothetical protein IJN56_01600 [Clostridia bacterium]|nr:hypothetical protein [Clostridia bacterium]
MKNAVKVFAVLFSILILLTFCSCKVDDTSDLTSSTPQQTQSTNTLTNSQTIDDATAKTLLHRISANDDINTIECITVSDKTSTEFPTLINKQDMTFLQKYTYSHYRTDKRENWDGWLQENSILRLTVDTKNQGEYYLYLIQDGSIAIQQMCGDSEVPEISYDFYTANKENQLTKEKLELL